MTDLALGLEPTHRFRCGACGNLTRFDVVTTERTRRFHHLELGGAGVVEEEEVLHRTVESVTCRWCGREDGIEVQPLDDHAAATSADGDGTSADRRAD